MHNNNMQAQALVSLESAINYYQLRDYYDILLINTERKDYHYEVLLITSEH